MDPGSSVPVAFGTVWPGDYSLRDPYAVTIGTLPAPAASSCLIAGNSAHQLAEQSIGGIAAVLVLLRRHIGHIAKPATTMRVLRGDDNRRFIHATTSATCRWVRSLLAVTIAGPVIAAAWTFLRGGRFGRWT
jgi:hypothetical protein